MKRQTLIVCSAVAIVYLFLPAKAFAEDYTWTDNGDGTCTITHYIGPGGAVTIPGTITGLTVTRIGDNAFHSCTGLTSVMIPDSVTSIGNWAFYCCTSLTSVTIPDNVTSIGNQAFYTCTSLTSITIGDNVTDIGQRVFAYCTSLTSITIPDSVTSIGAWTFDNCTSLTSATIGNGVTSIGTYAFYKCSSLTSVTIPDSVISIGSSAFHYCSSLTSVAIPDGVTSIGNSAFCWCSSMTSITIPDSVISIGDSAFSNCTNLTSIMIPDSVTGIGRDTFRSCTHLTSITIGSNVASIGDYAFFECTSLANVEIGNSVTSVGAFAFYSCTSLTSITIPESVTGIGDRAFQNCSSLTGVYFKGNPPTLGSIVFAGDDETTIYYLPDNAANWPATFGGRPTEMWGLPVVNTKELALLASYWQMTGCDEIHPCSAADWYIDGTIDVLDLNQLAMSWLGEDMVTDSPISAHIFEIEMSLSYDFGEGYGSSVPDDYQFDAWMQVDDTVVAGTLQTPGGVVYPAEMEVDDGENWLGVYAASDSLADLSDFTDGEYIFTVTYANGKSQSTSILFALADGSPIPPVDQPLVVTYPLHNAADVPLTINVEMAPLNNPDWTYGIWCEPVYDDSALSGEIDDLPFDTTTAGPLELSPDTLYEMEITVNHAIWSTNEDGIPYVIDKDSEVEILFTTVSTL